MKICDVQLYEFTNVLLKIRVILRNKKRKERQSKKIINFGNIEIIRGSWSIIWFVVVVVVKWTHVVYFIEWLSYVLCTSVFAFQLFYRTFLKLCQSRVLTNTFLFCWPLPGFGIILMLFSERLCENIVYFWIIQVNISMWNSAVNLIPSCNVM